METSIATLKAQVAFLTSNLRAAERRIARLEEATLKSFTAHPVEAKTHDQRSDEDINGTEQPSLIITTTDEILLIRAFRKLKEEQQRDTQPCSPTAKMRHTESKRADSSQDESRPEQASSAIDNHSAHEASSSFSQHKPSDPNASPSQPFPSKPKFVFGQPSTPYRRERSLNLNFDASPFGNYVDKESPFSRLASKTSCMSLAESWHQERKILAKDSQPIFGAPPRRGQDSTAKAF